VKTAGEMVPVAGGAEGTAVGADLTQLYEIPVETTHAPAGRPDAVAARGLTMGVQMQCLLVQSPPIKLTGGEFMIVPSEEQNVWCMSQQSW
jgi:hypothetical protein